MTSENCLDFGDDPAHVILTLGLQVVWPRFALSFSLIYVWLGSVVVRALDLRFAGSTPGRRVAE